MLKTAEVHKKEKVRRDTFLTNSTETETQLQNNPDFLKSSRSGVLEQVTLMGSQAPWFYQGSCVFESYADG